MPQSLNSAGQPRMSVLAQLRILCQYLVSGAFFVLGEIQASVCLLTKPLDMTSNQTRHEATSGRGTNSNTDVAGLVRLALHLSFPDGASMCSLHTGMCISECATDISTDCAPEGTGLFFYAHDLPQLEI